MEARARSMTTWRQLIRRAVVLLALWSGASGCVGPNAVRYTRLRYNEVIRDTNDQQLLLNIVRLRYADSPVFIDLPNITSQFEVAGRGNYLGGAGNQFRGQTNLGFGELSLRDSPTLSYHPREGREIAKALLTPLSSDLFIVVNAGANLEQLLLMSINDINDVPNAPGPRPWSPGFPTTTRSSSEASGCSRRSVTATPPSWRSGRTTIPTIPPTRFPGARSRARSPERRTGRLRLPQPRGGPGDPAQAGKGALPPDSPPIRPLPRDGGSGADLPPDSRPEQVPDQV